MATKGTLVQTLPTQLGKTIQRKATRKAAMTKARSVVDEWPFDTYEISTERKKPTMFIKLRKRFLNWLRVADHYDDEEAQKEEDPQPRDNSWNSLKSRKIKNTSSGNLIKKDDIRIDSRGVKFTVYPARGGIVIEAVSYDERTDNNIASLHVVPEGDDLDVAMANIIVVEAMRH